MSILAGLASLVMGFVLGLLGGGGSILAVPILVYMVGVDAKSAIATSLLVVGSTAVVAALGHARAGNVDWRTAFIFGAFAMLGAFGGGALAAFVPSVVLLIAFGGLMLITSIAMLRKGDGPVARRQESLPIGKIALEGVVVGGVTGLVGAGGGFLVVPALVLLGGLPMKRAIGTSLVVIAMKSFAGFGGYAAHVEVDYALAAIVAGLALGGSLIGAQVAQRVDAGRLRSAFAVFVLVMGLGVLWREVPVTADVKWAFIAGALTTGGIVMALLVGRRHQLPQGA